VIDRSVPFGAHTFPNFILTSVSKIHLKHGRKYTLSYGLT
jgi:hypothetical protein